MDIWVNQKKSPSWDRYSSNADAKAGAQKIAQKYPKGKKVTVYYMPDNREIFLEPGFSYKVFGWLLDHACE